MTLTLLGELASGPDWRVREVAVTALGNIRPGDAETLTLLHEWASGRDWRVREVAVTALGNIRPGDPETLRLLRHQASSDPDPDVRRAATRAILQSAVDDPQTF